MASRRNLIFRVTGLARVQPDESLAERVKSTLSDNLSSEERSQIQIEVTVVPSCYDPDRERVALVQFHGKYTRFLSELIANPLWDWQVEMGGTDINIDSHFFGFTQLYATPETETVTADIIAITGLDGHAYGSWRGKGNLGRMWLRDFLSKDLPRCRTMIYGYDSKLFSHGVDTILDYGRELMVEIKKIRSTKELQQRPLFFITHSFGGIILAHCLVRAIQAMDDDHPAITSLHKATYGMVFFAAPHKGLVVDDIQQMLTGGDNHPRSHLLRQISDKSDVLIHQLADFKNLIRDRKVVSFYETGQTRQLKFDPESRQWRRTGEFITAVGADSALLQLPDHTEDKVPLRADHSTIVKFDSRNASGYQTVMGKLLEFEKDAPSVVAGRFSRSQSGPKPISTVPFKRDTKFVGREDTIGEIEKRNKQAIGRQHERTALFGLAGVGKSQVAIEYSYRVRESMPDIWVFWVHASNMARFEQGYQYIASAGDIYGRDDAKKNILQLVYLWLCDERNGNWLLVLDNADDDSIFFYSDGSHGKLPLVNYLPQVAHGCILVTSRNKMAARNLVGTDGDVIEVRPMNEEDSLALLRMGNLASQSPPEDERALVKELEYIPLAITQAAAYIANRSPRITVSKYLRLFKDGESNQAHLLNHEGAKDLRRDPSIRHAVITTWQLSFDQIRDSQSAAADLLALMSMFDRQGVPSDLVQEDKDTLRFEDELAPLISFSLVREEDEGQHLFDLHRLVQLSVRKWLEIHQQLDKWREKSRKIMAQMFPNGKYETWATCQKLLPHSKEVMKFIPLNDNDQLHAATIASNSACYLFLRGQFTDAEAIQRRALAGREKVLPPDHPAVLTSVMDLGLVLERLGNFSLTT
ncbi:hypothetical protein BJX68DRAFT_271365 [Aspergillus pseudodeflectus]|uniref:NB-ARC domain-containing protein n=1 Tax=Aspergillus pseudodeflectus TaxID=176178 RepID=A0ABR4JLI1_9EURO